MTRLIYLFCLILMAAAMPLTAKTLEERLRLEHIEPSEAARRIDLFTGAALGFEAPHLVVVPNDAAKTLTVRISDAAGGAIEQQRIRLMLRALLRGMDRPEPPMRVMLYVVAPDLLSPEDFATLDRKLRRAPLELQPGTTAKGVLFWKVLEGRSESVLQVAVEKPPTSQDREYGSVLVAGRVLPAVQENGNSRLDVDVALESTGRPLAGERQRIELKGRALDTNVTPLIMVAGRQLPDAAKSRSPRHELMVYLWAVQTSSEEKKEP